MDALRRPAVLTYHGVEAVPDGADPVRLLVSPARLTSHVRLLKRLGYRFTTADALVGRAAEPGEAVLTFDDGFLNWLTDLLPVLEAEQVPATLYLCPGLWGTRHPDVPGAPGRLLDRAQAQALAASPWVELGSHAMTHRDLRLLDDASLRAELVDSKDAVEQLTGRPCTTHAYPYGLHDARVVEAAGEAGYALAWDWLPGRWRRPLAAPRLPAPTTHGPVVLALKLAGVRRRWGR